MRPRSMTGFGRGEVNSEGLVWIAEVRTVNHRYLDQRVIMPRSFSGLEDRVRKIIASNHDRGRVDVSLQRLSTADSGMKMAVNVDLVRQYHSCLMKIKSELNLESPILLQDMLTQRDMITFQESTPDFDKEWPLIIGALDVAIGECCFMREQEGKALKDELLDRLESFSYCIEQLEEKAPQIVNTRLDDVKKRLAKIQEGVDVDPMRLAQEATILADKSDVTEEIVRLRSHISQFANFMESNEPVGRRLDFILQEFLREVNTISSKISNAEIAHMTVDLKNEIEKLREQVQNIE